MQLFGNEIELNVYPSTTIRTTTQTFDVVWRAYLESKLSEDAYKVILQFAVF